jgi:excisionase family DNA binding protein
MTVSQVAIVLRCSPRRVVHLIHSKRLPAIRAGNSYYVNRTDVDRWLRPTANVTPRLH